LRDWWDATGFDQEAENYRALMNQIMHQGDITDAAYALVPYLVWLCQRGATRLAVEYLTDIAWIETMRLSPDPPAMPDFLAFDYQEALKLVPDLVDDAIDQTDDAEQTWGLEALKPALHGNAKLALKQWTGRDE
jgi:hypothetical protein